MNTFQQFAHSEDLHDTATSDLEHLLTSAPVAVPLFIVVNILLFQLTTKYKKSATLPALLGFNLLVGVLSFDTVPAVSIIAITAGITSALLISLTLLAGK